MIAFEIEQAWRGGKWYWVATWEEDKDSILFDSGPHPTRDDAHAELERIIEACRTGSYIIEDMPPPPHRRELT